jgi:hypothetical protein
MCALKLVTGSNYISVRWPTLFLALACAVVLHGALDLRADTMPTSTITTATNTVIRVPGIQSTAVTTPRITIAQTVKNPLLGGQNPLASGEEQTTTDTTSDTSGEEQTTTNTPFSQMKNSGADTSAMEKATKKQHDISKGIIDKMK